jgi:putative tRNA adenosine deaminase-associated protein
LLSKVMLAGKFSAANRGQGWRPAGFWSILTVGAPFASAHTNAGGVAQWSRPDLIRRTVSYFAAALARVSEGWTAAELDLDGADDVEAVGDLLRDVQPDAELSLLFVESDDEYLVVLRLDEGEDLRVFGSDVEFADASRIGDVLLAELEESEVPVDLGDDDDTTASEDDEEEEEETAEPVGHPVGDADLLTDLGISARDLLALCSHEGMLPADVMTEICRKIGCADELQDLRGE